MHEFGADVAFYGFPFNSGFANGTAPAAHIAELESPLLMIHGSRDQASTIADIYNYTRQLDAAGTSSSRSPRASRTGSWSRTAPSPGAMRRWTRTPR